MITPEQRIPAAAGLHAGLPVGEDALEFEEVEIGANPFLQVRVIDFQVMEVEGHRQLFGARPRITNTVFETGRRHLADIDQVMTFEHFAVHLLQVFVNIRPVGIEASAVGIVLGKVRRFRDQVDHIQPEPAHTFIPPESHHLENFGAHLRVVPVQVGLSVIEQVQEILAGLSLVLPCRTTKLGLPVIGLIAPDVEVTIRIVETAARLLEPGVLDRGVVDHDIEHQFDPALAGLGDQQFTVGHGAVARIDGVVITDVVTVVTLGRTQERRDPQAIDAQPVQVVELGHDAEQITRGIACVAVKTLRVDLVDHRTLPVLHGCIPS
ncbi:hypothetical protein D3C84_661040 [compost metagenome]